MSILKACRAATFFTTMMTMRPFFFGAIAIAGSDSPEETQLTLMFDYLKIVSSSLDLKPSTIATQLKEIEEPSPNM
jgi:hypothetical protein